ncbi:putative mitochondrial ribosomal protein isoform X1 [Bombyx mori]|uniref:Small ribosomal subunit protein mS23 n=1 Tax=Bombyx mori TaxID=7091 RepID=A0FDR0_BOMMO|nr:putative mitochondrial ribosomal protein [Bombyx mori]ABJ97190.1 putative mitochondrial ribosomal protein [Bombyx mori]
MASSRLERIGTIFTRVEGLLSRGAMKPDDRPLWFDVYKAFPPITEPKYARPNLVVKEIRPILYKEDVLRAKFHSNGYGLAPVSLLNQSNETQTKRLVQQYDELKAEGIPEDEIIEKAAQAVAVERHSYAAQKLNVTPKNPDSVTAQVLAEADIKNIFNNK